MIAWGEALIVHRDAVVERLGIGDDRAGVASCVQELPHEVILPYRFGTGQIERAVQWVPFGFCVFLSLVTIALNLWLSIANGASAGGWAVAFLCFLPMCFFFVGAATSQMQGEILELRRQVVELQAKKAGG